MSRQFVRSVSTTLALFVTCALLPGIAESRADTIVAVIDSGVDASHSDLQGRLIPGFDLTAGDDPNADMVGHGTAMASLIAGEFSGACDHCRILPVKITDNMTVSLDLVAAAIGIAVREGSSVIYVGAGATGTNDRLTRAVENAHAAGVTVVAPVGTQGLSHPLYPAAYPSVIAVAGLDRNGYWLNSSNEPGENALFANGEDVKVAEAGGGYMRVTGSSPAAAIVAGQRAQAAANHAEQASATWRATSINLQPVDAEASIGNPLVATLQYGDTDDTDIIMDAPWRTIRDYLPVLVFTPELEQTKYVKRTIQRIELYNYDRASKTETDLIFQDLPGGADTVSCHGQEIEIIDADGHARSTIGSDEPIGNFWHYVVRVPVGCIGVGQKSGSDGEHYLLARTYWLTTTTDSIGKSTSRSFNVHRVLRVLLGSDGFPRFDPDDHYYDAHVHTIAEQTAWVGLTNVDAGRKAFGGPLAMLIESAYALGLIDTQLHNGNWTAFRDQLATTDHNAFFSGNPYDAGSHPGYGPTSDTNGKAGEFQWYREHFGELSGEEVTLWGTSRHLYISDMTKAQGSHFLVYGGPHFEGPWHGGKFTVDLDDEQFGADLTTLTDLVGVENPNRMDYVLDQLSHTDAFGYAAHPFNSGSGWSKEYFEKAIGLPPNYNDGGRGSRILQNNARDFIFKGSQVWNEKNELRSTAEMDGKNLKVKDLEHLDPYSSGASSQRFQADLDWDRNLNGSLNEYIGFLERGLKYSFLQQPNHRFVRKLYMSAGTDAHGDFNYLSSMQSTAEAEIHDAYGSSAETGVISSNAFGRVRTYTLTGEKLGRIPEGAAIEGAFAGSANQTVFDESAAGAAATTSVKALRASVMAYREGNTILTDGPICKFSVDSECRFNSGKGSSRWHDGSCAWENADGRIGGEGNFDGGGSVLISRDSEAMVNTVWDGRNDYISTTDGQPDNSEMILAVHSTGAVGGIMVMDGGPRGVAQHTKLAKEIAARLTERKDYAPSVLMLRANLGADETRASCITNPVWTIPVKFYYPSPPSECSIDAGDLRVSISFGVSMDSTLSDRCAGGDCLAPVNGSQAAYQGPTIKVYPLDGSGQSVGNGIRLTPRWYANNLAGPGFRKIENANLVGDNDVQIACPSGGWDATTHSVSPAIRSYAVVVTDLRDMHGNELNAIADTFTVTKGRTPKSPQRPSTGTGPVLDPNRAGGTQAVPCSSSSVTMCKSYGASCSAIAATNGSRQDVCAWSAANSAAACKRTAGIWTTAGSRYAKNHPGAVRPGQSGACLTEVKNLENRIQ